MLFAVCCVLLVGCCLLAGVSCFSLFGVRCSLYVSCFVVRCVVCCSLFGVCCLLLSFARWWSLCVVRCSLVGSFVCWFVGLLACCVCVLFGVRCVLLGVCRLSCVVCCVV